jgi:hypothetical protein
MGAPAARTIATMTSRPPGGSGECLSLAAGGTFARALEGSYYTGAATDGLSAFLAWASSGVRRVENRGDGLGAGLLMERAATNYILRSRELDHAAWTVGGATITPDQNGGPDASGTSDRDQIASTAFGPYQVTPGPAGQVVCSAWVRRVSGTGTNQLYLVGTGGAIGIRAAPLSITTTYVRNEAGGVATTNSGMLVADGRDLAGAGVPGGGGAHAEDNYADLVQLEAGYYPTSAIRTTSATVTRPADALSYASGSFPSAFLSNGVTIVFAPDASSAEIVSASEDWRLLHIVNGFNFDGVRIRATGGVCKVELVCNGSAVAERTVTFSRGQALTITAKPAAGKLTVSGASTGDGSNTGSGASWTSSATLYVGGDDAVGHVATGRFLDARGGGSVPTIAGAPVT